MSASKLLRSIQNRATPMFCKWAYFFRIIAGISVPPLEAPRWNSRALPAEGRDTARMNSSMGWSVRGPARGTSPSKTISRAESRTLAKAVVMANSRPTNKNAASSNIRLAAEANSLAVRGVIRAMMVESPATPPKQNWFGNRKK